MGELGRKPKSEPPGLSFSFGEHISGGTRILMGGGGIFGFIEGAIEVVGMLDRAAREGEEVKAKC